MSASNDDLDVGDVRSRGVDRRTLIKGAAVAGVAAWTAPMIVDSFSSAAAAAVCSASPTVTFKTSLDSNADTQALTFATPAITATAGSKIVVYIAQSNKSTSGSAVVFSVTGNAISGAVQTASVLNYNNNNATRTHDFFVWTGTGVAAASQALTVTFTNNGNQPFNVSLSVYQVTGAATVAATTGTANNSANAVVNYVAPPPANNVELWGVAGGDNNTAGFNWNIPGAPLWAENVDLFNTAGGSSSRSFSFETANRSPAVQNSGTFTTSGSETPDWAAIRVLLGC